MQQLQFDPMKEALKKKRLAGIDLTIMIGKPDDKDLEKGSDLAPNEEGEEGMEQKLEGEEEVLAGEQLHPGQKVPSEEEQDKMMMEGMGVIPGSINRKAREAMSAKYKKGV